MSTPGHPAAKSGKSRHSKTLHALDELARLRGQLRRPAAPAEPATQQQKKPDGHATADSAAPPSQQTEEPGDAQLFRRAVRDAAPLRASDRAELETPKPPPLPRPRERQAAAPPAAPPAAGELSDEDYFLAMMAEVLPQKNDGRIESGPRRNAAHRTEENAPLLAGILPPGSDAMTPQDLFRLATSGIQPLDMRNRAEIEPQRPRPEPLKRVQDEQSALYESLHTPMTLEDRLDAGDETAFLRAGLPRRTLPDLRRGRWTLQGEIDLHGFNRDEARVELSRFLASCLQQGHRCVRVIHGKGLGSPGRQSILKQLSRGWLAQREEILAFCQAGPNQGGSGALLVLLRSPNAK